MFFVLLMVAILPLKQTFWNDDFAGLTPIKYVGAAAALYAVFYAVMRGRTPDYLGTWQARLYLLFTLLAFVSYLGTDSEFSNDTFLAVTSLFLLCFTLLSVVDSVKRLRWVLLAGVGSVGWASLYVIREWQKNRGWATGFRGGWIVGDVNHFSVSAIFAIAVAWCLAKEPMRPAWERRFCQGCMLLSLAALVVGASRGGLLGLVAAMLFVAARSHRRARNLTTVLVLLGGFNLAYPHSPFWRFLDPNHSDIESSDNHRASWEASLRMISDHPLTGIGIGTFKSQMEKYRPAWYDGPPFMAHNAYLGVTAEMGIPCLPLFLGVLIATYVSLEKTYRNRFVPPLLSQAAVGLQASLLGCAIAIFFFSAEYHEHLWFTVFMSMPLPPLAARFAARARAAAPGRGGHAEASQIRTEIVHR